MGDLTPPTNAMVSKSKAFCVSQASDENTSDYDCIRFVMDAITLRLKENTLKSLDKEADMNDVSRSEYIRNIIRARHDHEDIRTEYEEQISEYENRIDEYEDELAEKQATINSLKRELEAKETTIADFEERINDLEREHDRERAELEREINEIKQELETRDNTIDNLRNQLAATNRRVDQHQELVNYVREERNLERQRAEREERRAKAGILTKTKWALFGMSNEEESG